MNDDYFPSFCAPKNPSTTIKREIVDSESRSPPTFDFVSQVSAIKRKLH
jgi:hypothetical protein